ncbi:MAG: MFS transporter [Bryobacteraceae bacterium]
MMLVSLISYVDRNTLALLAPTILEETGLSAQDYGLIVSAFSVFYMLGNPVWGALLDRIGLRTGMLAAVSFWSLASTAHAWASGFWGFAFARAALGFGEGATFPGGLRTVTQTLNFTEQSRGIAVSYSGGSLGAMITPLVITPVVLWWGWRSAFLFTGLIGAAWLLMWFFVSRRADIRLPRPTRQADAGPVAIRYGDPRVWGFILAYSLGALPLGFVNYGTSIYLNRVHNISQADLGKLLWIPPFGWEVGYFVWGWWLDRLARQGVGPYFAARRVMFLCVFLSFPLALVPFLDPLWLIMLELFFAMFVTVGFVLPSVNYAVHTFTTTNSGLIAGIGAGSFGASVALFMPLFGRFFDQNLYWAAFGISAFLPIIGYISWRLIHPRPDQASLSYQPQQRAV